MKTQLIHHFLENSAHRSPDQIALVHDDTRISYEKINQFANRLAYKLIDQGIQTGDRIVILLENSLDYVISYYGCLKAGAIAVPLSTAIKPEYFSNLLKEIEPFAIISSQRYLKLIKAIDRNLISKSLLIVKDIKSADIFREWKIIEFNEIISVGSTLDLIVPISKDSIASIIYTSGSSGKPKGVMLTHHNIVSNTKAICQYLQLTSTDKQMVVLPFFYVMGKSLLNTHFAVGGTVVLNNQFAYPANVIKQMIEEKVTGFSGVPSTYAYLLHRSPLEKYRENLNTLRYCSQAGGHMANTIKRELRKVLPSQTMIYIMYGATEASARITYLRPEKYDEKIGSIGKPIPGVTLRIIDQSGKEVTQGEIGELVASGDNIMFGYWKDTEKSNVISSWGYHTGDLGYQDDEGYFYITGRKDNIIKVGGHRINPSEIEEAMMVTNLIVETAVIGVPDDLLGKKIVAIVVPKEKTLSNEILFRDLSNKLPKNKMPSLIKFVRILPKNANGKIDRDMCYKLATA